MAAQLDEAVRQDDLTTQLGATVGRVVWTRLLEQTRYLLRDVIEGLIVTETKTWLGLSVSDQRLGLGTYWNY